MKKPRDKQKEVTAATFKRLAKALRVRARNHLKAAKLSRKAGLTLYYEAEQTRADIYQGVAEDCDNEARTLRAMR